MFHEATRTEAWVEVTDDEGKTWTKLPEYKVDVQRTSATCYVEARTGQRFRLLVRDNKTVREDFAAKFMYDGNLAVCNIFEKKWPMAPVPRVEGIRHSDRSILPFKFNEVRENFASP